MKFAIKITCMMVFFNLAACATAVVPQNPFNENDLAWSLKKGTYSVSGEAFTMTVSGEPRTCAGQSVALMPVSNYTDEVVAIAKQPHQYAKRDPRLANYLKKTNCNSKGEFKFTDVPEGQYYFEGAVMWYAGTQLQVAIFRKKLDVKGNITYLSIQSEEL